MRLTGVILSAMALATAAQAAGKTRITPIELTETRAKQFAKKVKFPSRSELKLTVHVEGSEVNQAVSYGKVTFDEAVDDAGTDLKPKKEKSFFSTGDDDKFTSLRDGIVGMHQDEKEKGFRIPLTLGVSSRKATRISRLKGQFQVLAGGEAKTVTVKKLKSLIGKKITDPALKGAGLEVQVVDPKKAKDSFFGSGGDESLTMEFKGDLKVLQDVDIVDARGKSVSHGHMSSGTEDKKTFRYDLDKPLDDKIVVKINLTVGLKTITVPFDLKDIELP